jgi:hypothetical protein
MFLLGVGLAQSPVRAEADAAALAPWQAHPSQGQQIPPDDSSSGCGCGRKAAAPSRACDGEDCDADDGPCDKPCSVTDWCHWPRIFEPHGQLSFRGEYLAWWTKTDNLPVLATIGTAGDVLFGGDDGNQGLRSGGRFTLAYWLSPCRDVGMEVTYLTLGAKSAGVDEVSNGSVTLARPYFDVSTAQPNSVIVADPGERRGWLGIRDANELDTVEVLFRRVVFQETDRQFEFLMGYRFGRFDESIGIGQFQNFIATVGNIRQGTIIQESDLFRARNEFNGAEIGFVAKSRCNRWSLEMLTKLALGNTTSRTNISGNTLVNAPGSPLAAYNAGVLALPTNIGSFERNDFSVMPELGITLGYDITCRLKATVGWSFLYWSDVMRPGDQIDTNLNPTQFPSSTLRGVPAPQFKPVTTDFWAQGINIGLDYRY